MATEWSPWIEHDGSPNCPVEARDIPCRIVDCRTGEDIECGRAGRITGITWSWRFVKAYCIPMEYYRNMFVVPEGGHQQECAASAPDFLSAALSHMKDRAATYDRPTGERSIGRATDAFKAITGDGKMDSDERGWLFMVLLKLARTQQGDYRADNYEDGAAYVALMGEAAAQEKGND